MMARFNVEDCVTSRSPGRVLRRLDKVMRGVVQSRFDGLDLDYTEWVALKMMHDGLVSTAGELARELGITSGATTRLIDRLQDQGLMTRDRTGRDRRVVRLALTPAGEATAQRLMGRAMGAWNDALAGFEQADAAKFVDMLVELLASAERLLPTRELEG